jgi:hypothetical protein
MAEFFVETQCWAHWPKVLVMGRNRNDGTVERRRYVPERTCHQVITDCNDGLLPPFTAHCSECGTEWGYTPAYCPECGAKVVDE